MVEQWWHHASRNPLLLPKKDSGKDISLTPQCVCNYSVTQLKLALSEAQVALRTAFKLVRACTEIIYCSKQNKHVLERFRGSLF